MNFMKIFARNLMQGPYTDPFPFGPTFTPKDLRGRVAFDEKNCTGCRACEQVCVGGAIRFDKTPEGLRFLLWHNTCTFCGLCEFYCPTKAIHLTNDWHMAHAATDKFTQTEAGLIAYTTCAQCGVKALASAPNVIGLEPPVGPEEFEQLRNLCPGCRRKALLARGKQP